MACACFSCLCRHHLPFFSSFHSLSGSGRFCLLLQLIRHLRAESLLPLLPLQPTRRSHGYSSQRQEGRPQERLQVREMWSDLPGGPRRRDDAPRPVRSPHRCLWRRVPGCRAGVPDCGAAGAVREGGRAEREEAVPPEPAHRDAGCAPRRRHRHASEERDLVSQRRCAEHQQGDGKEEGRQEGQGDTERVSPPA
ncbi:putative histone H2A [Leishmania infantum JPCM5]|uniref:Putative histone H2A n=1 Tax=Leishmania infantum TaxID=5671 RepID=A4I4N4_LEIIN|nr:putative histone H2A [Leishmania infantum JPCM5]CAM69746.1 putative histone H2A [Leishmania infantum JPCM5]|eukprot:XP_001466703.1 putative histone H2A [Leishmania infantum JPCM5]